MKFNPEITTGHILQIATIIAGVAIGYGTYREDQSRQDSRIHQIEVIAERDRTDTQKTMVEVKARLDKQGDQLQDIKESLAILRGRAAEAPRSGK
jgi:hypothetical protein